MAASLWKLNKHGTLTFQPKLCRYLRGINFEKKPLDKLRTVRAFLEDFPGFKSPKAVQGRHPGEFPTLKDVLKELNAKDPELPEPVDIGLPYSNQISDEVKKDRHKHVKQMKMNTELERAVRLRTFEIPINEVKAEWERTDGPQHAKVIAEHYGVFRDLFHGAYFVPQVPLSISFEYDNDSAIPVYRGNHIKPSEASKIPDVQFEAKHDTLWTLVLTNPDGHLMDNSSEYLHWFIGNIPGNALEKGDLICDYLQPFPPKGTGYHRFIFILYKQDKHIDYSGLQRPAPCLSLKERTFNTYNFYKEHQDILTPAGLAFFQSDWDESLSNFFHQVLLMKEPSFEYNFPPPNVRKQAAIPFKQPFNTYLDKYRDPKDIGKEILLKRFQNVHPFKEEPLRPKYPNAYPYPSKTPAWLKTEMFKERLRVGKYRGLDIEIFKPIRRLRPLLGIYHPRTKDE